MFDKDVFTSHSLMILHKQYSQCIIIYSQLADFLGLNLGSTIYCLWDLGQIIQLSASVSHLYYSTTLGPTSKDYFGELIEIMCLTI